MKNYIIKTKGMVIEPVDEENIWEGDWNISIFGEMKNAIQIGKASFAGEKMNGAVPLTITLEDEYRNKGYGTEAFKLLVDFAFGFRNIYEVKAVTPDDNDSCVHALEKSGFVIRSTEHHIANYSVTKQKSSWLGLYLYIGIIAGLILGIVFGSTWVGLVIGIVLGLMAGGYMENQVKKAREKITGNRDQYEHRKDSDK